MVRSFLATPLLIITVMLLASVAPRATTTYGWILEASCVDPDTIVSSTTVPDPPQTFEVFAEDHVPGDGWEEVEGSRQEFTSHKEFMEFVLDVSGTRPGADLYIVGLSTGEETVPFATCPELTPTFTATPEPTDTPVPPTKTRVPNTPTRTATKVAPSATSTPLRTVGPSVTPGVPKTPKPCTNVICLPETGSGGHQDKNYSAGQIAFRSVAGVLFLAGVFVIFLGGLVYRRVKRRRV